MLRLIPPPLHRLLLDIVHRVRVRWWRWARPRLRDCRVIARDADGRVLLVRHSYGSGVWMLPGGAPRRGEDPLAAAGRELSEEVGCRLERPVLLIAPPPDAERRTFIVAGHARGAPRADRREIVAAAFFAPDALPDGVSGHLVTRLPAWLALHAELSRRHDA